MYYMFYDEQLIQCLFEFLIAFTQNGFHYDMLYRIKIIVSDQGNSLVGGHVSSTELDYSRIQWVLHNTYCFIIARKK